MLTRLNERQCKDNNYRYSRKVFKYPHFIISMRNNETYHLTTAWPFNQNLKFQFCRWPGTKSNHSTKLCATSASVWLVLPHSRSLQHWLLRKKWHGWEPITWSQKYPNLTIRGLMASAHKWKLSPILALPRAMLPLSEQGQAPLPPPHTQTFRNTSGFWSRCFFRFKTRGQFNMV